MTLTNITNGVTICFIIFLAILFCLAFAKVVFNIDIDPSFISGSSWFIIVLVAIVYFYSFLALEGEKDEDKKKPKFYGYIFGGAALLGALFILWLMAEPGFLGEKYISHIWLICFICSYSTLSHYTFKSSISPIINILITIFFSVCVFFYVSYAGASTFTPIKHIYELFDFLLLSKQLSMWNVISWLLVTMAGYYLYTEQRYSKDKCVWNTNTNPKTKSFIAVIYFVLVIYPFILHWRTYSIENTDLVHSKLPLLCFSLLMFGLFFQLAFDGRKNDDIADNDQAKKDNCDNIGRIDYFGSGAFNYIIWMCVGLLCNSIQISRSKNLAVKNLSIAGIQDSVKYFGYNFWLTILHGLGTIFGGATLW